MNETSPDKTTAEMTGFINQIKQDPDMEGLTLQEQQGLWRRIEHQNRTQDNRYRRILLWSGGIAVSIGLLLVAGWYFLASDQAETVDFYSAMQRLESANETAKEVQLVLSGNRTIAIEGEETQVDYSDDEWVDINQSEKKEVKKATGEETALLNQLVVPAGKRSRLTLNDGTTVWVNSGSKLVFPVNFAKNKREVFVEGEIYLEVTPDVDRPFIVHTQSIDVNVLGTRFNVSAYTDQPDLQVVLVSGKVEIRKGGDFKEVLQPNQMYSYHSETDGSDVSTVDAIDYIAWKDGYYIFNSQDLGAIFTKLSKYYNAQFNWDEKVKNLVCSGKLDLKEDLQMVLHSLAKAVPTVEILKISEKEYTIIVKP